MERTIIYARVSTEDQVEKYGLPIQLRACREFSQAAGGCIIEEITDDGVSGVVLDRPGLARVRQRVAAGEVDLVLMLDVDRLSRELAHLLILKPEIEKRARLEFVNARFEDSPSGRMFFGIRGVIGQYERELTRERTMRGKRERALAGLVVGGRTAYGYRYKAGKLVPDGARAETVREIFGWYEAGLSIRGITRKLRENLVPTWSGGKWGHSSVRRILINETYAGVAHYGTHRREGTVLRLREPNNRIDLIVPALISRELYERTQARLAENPQVGRASASYLMRGLLYCSCGHKMALESRHGWRYRCSGRDSLRHEGDLCHTAVNAPALDEAIWAEVVRFFTDAEFLRGLLQEHEVEVRNNPKQNVESLERQARRTRAREEACVKALLDPDLAESRSMIKAEHRKAQAERRRIDAELATRNERQHEVVNAREWLIGTVDLLREYVAGVKAMEERQAFMRGFCERASWSASAREVSLQCFLSPQLTTTSARCVNRPPPLPKRAWPWFVRGHRGNRAKPPPLPPPAAPCRWVWRG
jgi:site-specific DNA recombinase